MDAWWQRSKKSVHKRTDDWIFKHRTLVCCVAAKIWTRIYTDHPLWWGSNFETVARQDASNLLFEVVKIQSSDMFDVVPKISN